MSANIAGKVVVITGASSGLGEATARLLSKQGASVALGAFQNRPTWAVVQTLLNEISKSSVVLDRELDAGRASIRPAPASAARSAAGRPARTTCGLAPAAMSGTRSTREQSARRASSSGLRPSASRVPAGRRTHWYAQ
jgi:NAD(P)-dependent dehydrogenase (short-subunit alcohol dehydrogenase family)